MSTLLMLRRVERMERQLCPRLSPNEELVCSDPAFRRLIESLGFDFDLLRSRGSVIGALPHDVLVQLLERVRAAIATKRATEDQHVA